MAGTCSHLDSIRFTELPDPVPGCEECLKEEGRWVHLRMCLACGKLGCCDTSRGRHASAHFRESGHPLVRTAEPHEDWVWCFADETYVELDTVERAGSGPS